MTDQTTDFKIELYCESLLSTEVVSLSFPAVPDSFEEITEAVEEKCSIPTYCQIIWIQENKIEPSPSNTPASFYLQSGDTLRISYQTKCECKSVKKAIQWLDGCTKAVLDIKNCETIENVKVLYQENRNIVDEHESFNDLCEDIFTPWNMEDKKMNAYYFDHLGGVTKLVELHEEMNSLRSSTLFTELHTISECYEFMICSVLGSFASEASLRRRVTLCGGLERCLTTFMTYPADNWEHRDMWHFGLFALCNLSDIPENQLYISKKKDVIDQVLSLMGSHRHFVYNMTSMAVMLLLNLAQTKGTHVNIFKEDLVSRVIDGVDLQVKIGSKIRQMKVLQCYTGVLLAQLILGSPGLQNCFDPTTLHKTEAFLENVLDIDPMEIGRHEKLNDTHWGSFLRLVYLYEPRFLMTECHPNRSQLCHLQELSSQVILHSLQSTLWRKEHVPVLIEEKLLDYVIMLPWFVSDLSKDRSISVVSELAKIHQIQPPPLSVICKGKLSKEVFGLSIIFDIKSNAQIFEIF